MSGNTSRVLDVGQCTPDHMMIKRLLTGHFGAEVDRAANVAEALAAMRKTSYTLVLVNRLIDEDRSEGIELVHQARADQAVSNVPIMMVSNIEDAQEDAVRAGAVRGFGKAQLGDDAALKRLAEHLTKNGD